MSRKLKITIIEDYDDFRNELCEILRDAGHDVIGLPMAEDIDDEPVGSVSQLYIIDLNLPGEDGLSLAARIRRAQPEAGIVIASARNLVVDRIAGYEAGADIFLTKPFSLEELGAVVAGFGQRLSNRIGTDSSQLVTLPPIFTQRERDSGLEFCTFGGLGNGSWRGALRVAQCQAPLRCYSPCAGRQA
jgi:DNA-binding response OmpR family regulator